MGLDPSKFHAVNVADTCAIWNVLSARVLLPKARSAGCDFCCTQYVAYEALTRKRTTTSAAQDELLRRLRSARSTGQFKDHAISIDDLAAVSRLETRQRLSKGELSSIAFAIRTRSAFLTDDMRARKLAAVELGSDRAQTTPHLTAWLYFIGALGDAEVVSLIDEHERMERPLRPHLQTAYEIACHARLLEAQSRRTGDPEAK